MKPIAWLLTTSCFAAFWGGGGGSAFAPAMAAEPGYGTIQGKFVFDGKAPAPKKFEVTRDEAVCGAAGLTTEHLVAGKAGELANVVIYALGDPDDFNVPVKDIHASYDKLKRTEVVIQSKACRFEPHVSSMWTEQKLVFKNSDRGIGHNPTVMPFNNPGFVRLIPTGDSMTVSLPKAEKIPVKVACSIHPWMSGYLAVRPDPYVAISAADGSFKIANMPVGKHSFQLWHEAFGYLKKITLKSGPANHNRGIHALEVKAGDNDLGEFTIKADDYKTQIGKLK